MAGFNIDIDTDTSGIDEFVKKLESVKGETEVPLTELFNDGFMRRHTEYDSFQEFVDAGNFTADFEDIPDDEWDAYVDTNTPFASGQAMVKKAATEWMKRQLS